MQDRGHGLPVRPGPRAPRRLPTTSATSRSSPSTSTASPTSFRRRCSPRRRSSGPPREAAASDLTPAAARHHRSARCPRPRRRGPRRARRRPGQSRRLRRHGRHRRCRRLCAPRHRARPRGAASAATPSTSPTASCRCCPSASPTICARCAKARSGRPCLLHGVRRRRQQAPAPLRTRRHALGRQALLRGSPGGDRRRARDETTGPCSSRCCSRSGRPIAALKAARDARAPLELDLPERQLILDAHGPIERVGAAERLDAHRLIEEFMIHANVAAAETLESQERRCSTAFTRRRRRRSSSALRDFLALDRHDAAEGRRP